MSLIVFAMPFSCGGSNHLCKKNLRGLKAIHLIDHKGLRGIGRGTVTYCLCYSNRSIQACTNPLASSTWRRESLKLIHHQKFSFTKIWLLATQFEIRQLNLKAALQILCNAIGKTPKDKAR